MVKVEYTKQLGEIVAPFSGKTLANALKQAEAWAVHNHAEINRYYVQISGRSIIVDYTQKAEE